LESRYAKKQPSRPGQGSCNDRAQGKNYGSCCSLAATSANYTAQSIAEVAAVVAVGGTASAAAASNPPESD